MALVQVRVRALPPKSLLAPALAQLRVLFLTLRLC
jgi:hypothetical protein